MRATRRSTPVQLVAVGGPVSGQPLILVSPDMRPLHPILWSYNVMMIQMVRALQGMFLFSMFIVTFFHANLSGNILKDCTEILASIKFD